MGKKYKEGYWTGTSKLFKPHGVGTFTYDTGDIYIGMYVSGLRQTDKAGPNKFAKYTFKNGAFYRGEFLKGRMNGTGRMKFPDGTERNLVYKDDIATVKASSKPSPLRCLRLVNEIADVYVQLRLVISRFDGGLCAPPKCGGMHCASNRPRPKLVEHHLVDNSMFERRISNSRTGLATTASFGGGCAQKMERFRFQTATLTKGALSKTGSWER
jgi:hypothetical protein